MTEQEKQEKVQKELMSLLSAVGFELEKTEYLKELDTEFAIIKKESGLSFVDLKALKEKVDKTDETQETEK